MKNIFKVLLISSVVALTFTGCKKDDDDSTPVGPTTYSSGDVTMDFTNTAGTSNLDVSGATNYTNEAGESFAVTKFKYYVSNVKLIKQDGSVFSVPESYYLIDEADQTTVTPVLPSIPGGIYTGIRYTIGVDSARNVSGSQTGALDPANGMFWTWNSGYIFVKMEGTSTASSNGNLIFHIGGFKESNNTNALRNVEFNFPSPYLTVNGSREAEIHIIADVLKMFKGTQTVSFATNNFQMSPGGFALTMANNYQNMFTFDHIHN
jgi:hypothetical protein